MIKIILFRNHIMKTSLFLWLMFTAFLNHINAQDRWKELEKQPKTLGIEEGYISLETDVFNLKLVKASQTVASLAHKENPDFDYTPGDRIKVRDKDSCYHLGDINLRLRTGNNQAWKDYSTATKRQKITSLNVSGALAAADLSNSLPFDIPLKVIRSWEMHQGDLVLKFDLRNESNEDVEIGSLGIPLIFNNILTGKSLDETHAENVFYDPYIGQEGGYLQAVRLNGKGPVLLVLPYGKTGFEAYNPLNDDPTPRGIAFEGFHEWMVHSKAHAENEWRDAEQWNIPSSAIIKPGSSKTYGIRLTLAKDVRSIEETLAVKSRPVVVGTPGYVLPKDVKAKLFLKYPETIKNITVFPENSISLHDEGVTKNGWQKYEVKGNIWGRVRVTITYADNLVQTINYKVVKEESQVIEDFGNFLLTEQWYDNAADPFNRDQSVISYDYEAKAKVLQDSRVWIAGLSDEGGAGSWLAAMMKQLVQPDRQELEKLERFYNQTLWGGIQYSEGDLKYGVRRSLYYYEPDSVENWTYDESINYGTWAAWSKEHSEKTERSFNYPHVTAAHWVMYHLSKYYQGFIKEHRPKWYLENAAMTAITMVEQAPYYAQFGQMEGSIFLMVLMDLKREGITDLADNLEKTMKKRADLWKSLNYPFGSEMAWDSTGQEEVYTWTKYFGYDDKASVTLNAILAYMPTMPHWGYNGSARRYWDFLYGGKFQQVERQLHHYGSGINSIPVLSEYREHSDDLYLLRVGYGGVMGTISNITEDGFAPAAFHSYPSLLKIDPYSGDYGPGFFGYSVNTASYLYYHDEFDWLGFGGNVDVQEGVVTLNLTTAAKSKVFIAPANLWLTLEAGKFESVSYDTYSGEVMITLEPKNHYTPKAFLRINQPSNAEGNAQYQLAKSVKKLSGALVIPLKRKKLLMKLIK